MRNLYTYLLLLIAVSLATGASSDPLLNILQEHYENFRYQEIIDLTLRELQEDSSIDEAALTDILRYKALAHYALGELDRSLAAFNSLLQINPDYTLESSKYSPKVIEFFNDIKTKFVYQPPIVAQTLPEIITRIDTLQVPVMTALPALKSALLPGWGQWSLDKKRKGTFLMAAALISLSGSLYYTWQTEQHERNYLNATQLPEIENHYDRYNSSFQKRNFFWGSFAVVWVLSQADLWLNDSKIPLSSSIYHNRHETKLAIRIAF